MSYSTTTGSVRPLLSLLLLTTLVACSGSGDEPAAPASQAVAAPAPVTMAPTAFNLDELRDKASEALRANRMYAPAGDNALEYYLALREKAPQDTYVASALTDLLPYALTAAELNITREDFEEASRLVGLIEQINAQAPALPRLKQAVSDGQNLVARRSTEENERAKREAETRARQLAEQQRIAQQQAADAVAARQLAALQEAQREAAAREQAAVAARREAEQRAAAEAAEAAARQAATATASAPAAPRAPALRAISTPAPRYPSEALRSGTAGEVLVEITIGTDGSVTNARVLRAQPARIFDREAINAVRRWKYEPIDSPTTVRRTLAFSPQQ